MSLLFSSSTTNVMSRCFFASGSGATSAPGRYAMDFAQSADTALQRISDAAGAEI